MTKNLTQNFQKLNSRSILKVPLQVMKVKDDLNLENSANSALCLLNSTFQTLRESFLEIMSKTKKTNLLYLFDEFNEIYAYKNEFTPIEIELVRVSRKLQILSSFLLEKICGMSNETVDCDDEQEEVRERLISRIETASLKLVENRNKLPVDVFDEESDLILRQKKFVSPEIRNLTKLVIKSKRHDELDESEKQLLLRVALAGEKLLEEGLRLHDHGIHSSFFRSDKQRDWAQVAKYTEQDFGKLATPRHKWQFLKISQIALKDGRQKKLEDILERLQREWQDEKKSVELRVHSFTNSKYLFDNRKSEEHKLQALDLIVKETRFLQQKLATRKDYKDRLEDQVKTMNEAFQYIEKQQTSALQMYAELELFAIHACLGFKKKNLKIRNRKICS